MIDEITNFLLEARNLIEIKEPSCMLPVGEVEHVLGIMNTKCKKIITMVFLYAERLGNGQSCFETSQFAKTIGPFLMIDIIVTLIAQEIAEDLSIPPNNGFGLRKGWRVVSIPGPSTPQNIFGTNMAFKRPSKYENN